MFIYNLKLNKKGISRVFIITSIIIIFSIISYGIYIIFFKNISYSTPSENIIEINEANYTNILKSANEDIESYIGKKVRVTGYVYRLIDFNSNQFVVARDMKFDENSPSLIVGFLCEYNKATKFDDNTWVEIIGTIQKGNFNGDIALLDVISIKETTKPEITLVSPPDKTYIPTSYMF